jgi:putative spermidine/putrescine transport system substrate-binding protein
MDVRTSLVRACALAALMLTSPGADAQTEPANLTIASWGGSYARSQILAFVDPFRKQSGRWVELVDFNGDLDRVRQQVRSSDVIYDIVDLEAPDLIRGCDEGLLQLLDDVPLLPGADGSNADEDYYPGMLRPCGIGSVIAATLLVFRSDQYEGAAMRPATAADLFDLQRFPGSRALRRTPRVNLEWALLADGVPADEIYSVLGTEDGLERALAKLDTIRDEIVWWTGGEEPFELLRSYRVAIASAYNGRVHARQTIWGEQLTPLWPTAFWAVDYWAIPTNAPNTALAREFLTFTSDTKLQALQANEIAYGPPRRSALDLVASAVRPALPTAPEHVEQTMRTDAEWWARNGQRVEARFAEWLEGRTGPGGSLSGRTRGRDAY